MLLFILGFICCWYIMAIVIAYADIDVFPLSFFKFITFLVWIIVLPISYLIDFIFWIKLKMISLLKVIKKKG